ncbi:MAG: deoxyribodipyrimidine photo-lyase [Holophagales bacterium]|nr:deoxyribodipyrimidine photo-lyase [Holophagales bacterium]MYG29783.1 deoxyribodipyrimidine photo-lyase [Holophagales bacterium]MYI79197.1 deoxyribodipyrimidine photo-lyase [Holophagales bacterium]
MTPIAQQPILVWFRRDLRLTDNPAWAWAVETGRPVVPVFVLDEEEGEQPIGGASRWWLHGSLEALDRTLRRQGSRLVLRRGNAGQTIAALARETGASTVVWNRLYEPAIERRDREFEESWNETGPEPRRFQAGLLFKPEDIRSGTGRPYRVFTPFWRKCVAHGFTRPVATPPLPAAPAAWPRSDDLERWELRCHEPDWAAGFREVWQPGEEGARKRLRAFLAGAAEQYDQDRDRPGIEATSRLSPHLHFGEIGPRQVAAAAAALPRRPREAFLRELGWREFSYHLLFHNPEMGTRNLRTSFDRMPWRDTPADLKCWQRGQTGYPIVDAGMRELWTTGWMHNRVRMLVASFLTKHLLIDWRHGADWFWDTLVDADWANNSCGWQWTAGSGADAAPYFRIFNPVAQSRRFDSAGTYVRRWVPELRHLPESVIHAPWQSTESTLAPAGVRLGETYPLPMVDHAAARERALDAWRTHVRGQPPADRR